jgi:peptidoglycan/LPS O-acetylase OafA/YrhL
MKRLTMVSGVCFLLILFFEILTAFRFLTASRIMDYHLVAMGSGWENLSVGMQTMTLNFMRAAGLGFLIAGVSMLFILFFPFRKGEQWSKWALIAIALTQSAIMMIIISSVKTHTPAVPPLAPFVVIGILSLAGFFSYRGVDMAK